MIVKRFFGSLIDVPVLKTNFVIIQNKVSLKNNPLLLSILNNKLKISIIGNDHVGKSKLALQIACNLNSKSDPPYILPSLSKLEKETWAGNSVTIDTLNDIQIVDTPGLSQQRQISESYKSTILESDVLIFLTTEKHQLRTNDEIQFLNKYSEKEIIFCFYKQKEEPSLIIDNLTDSISNIVNLNNKDHQKIVPLDEDGKEIANLVSILDFYIKARETSKLKTATFALNSSIKDSKKEIQAKVDILPFARQKVEELKLELHVEANRLHQEFKYSDLKSIDLRFADLNDSLRDYFRGMNVFSIFWRAAYLGDDIKLRLEQHALNSTENSLYYASGKFNEGVYHLFRNAESKLEIIPSIVDKNLSNSREWFQNVLEYTIAQAPKPGSLLLDPFALSGEVKKDNPIIDRVDQLKAAVDQLIMKTVLIQSTIWGTGLLVTHLGVPWAISLPFTGVGVGIGFIWMAVRWRIYKDHLFKTISLSHKTNTYDFQFDHLLTRPLETVISLAEKSISNRAEELRKEAIELKEIEMEVNQFNQKLK